MSYYQNLSVPFSLPIPGGLSPGKKIVVQGSIPSRSERFAVNLLTQSGDIAFHLNPSFKENRVVRNSICNWSWGSEESGGSMPVHPGDSFEITISCEPYHFEVSFNGCHFCNFSYRSPVNTVTFLSVDGDVVIRNVNFNNYGNNMNYNSASSGYDSGLKPKSGGLYPTIDPYPPDSTGRSPSPSAPDYGGFRNPSPTPPSAPAYPSYGGGVSPSLYPKAPGYPTLPHQGPYPQVPSPTPGGDSRSNSHSGSGFLDQAGAALAGIFGPAIMGGGEHNRTPSTSSTHDSGRTGDSGPSLLGLLGGAALAGAAAAAAKSRVDSTKDSTHSTSPAQHGGTLFDNPGAALAALGPSLFGGGMNRGHGGQPNVMDDIGKALSGIIGGTGPAGRTNERSRTPSTSSTHDSGRTGDSGPSLLGLLGGVALAGAAAAAAKSTVDSTKDSTRPTQHGGSLFDQFGSTLAGIVGGSGLTGATSRSQRGLTSSAGARSSSPPSATLPAQSRPSPPRRDSDTAGTGLSGGDGGDGSRSTGTGHHKKHKKRGILGGALGTAVAGAALTGHLNPIKATKKQLKAHKKALKYGLPIAGAGLGAYALHKGIKKGFRRSSSSSSSSSSSD